DSVNSCGSIIFQLLYESIIYIVRTGSYNGKGYIIQNGVAAPDPENRRTIPGESKFVFRTGDLASKVRIRILFRISPHQQWILLRGSAVSIVRNVQCCMEFSTIFSFI